AAEAVITAISSAIARTGRLIAHAAEGGGGQRPAVPAEHAEQHRDEPDDDEPSEKRAHHAAEAVAHAPMREEQATQPRAQERAAQSGEEGVVLRKARPGRE